MRLPRTVPLLLLLFFGCTPAGNVAAPAGKVDEYAAKVAPLIDPVKLRTLGERGANPRVQKAVYWLAAAKFDNPDPEKVAERAAKLAGYTGDAAKLTADALTRNLKIAEQLGCLDNAGLDEMRRGRAPTIRRGPYRGDELSVDHIIPRSVCYELDNVIANLELMPLRMNMAKINVRRDTACPEASK